ncbi:MAG: hypothetical protein AAGA81_09550 [Acidobacteriota bacterium]
MIRGLDSTPNHPPRSFRSRALWGSFLLLCFASLAGRLGAQDQPTISVDEVQRGQKGYGVTVFEGTETERFEVEVVGVLRDFNPGMSFILARLSGRGLEESGVAGGMSGSPVYIEGRLAGAVAFSWDFSTGALAGITPIAAMRDLQSYGGGGEASATARGVRTGAEYLDLLLRARADASAVLPETFEAELDEELARLVPTSVHSEGTSGVQLSLGGFDQGVRSRLERVAGAAPAGRMQPGAELPEIAGGSAVSALMIGGDLELAVNGTVTERRGDEILAFGHPWLGIGPLSVPMVQAEVVTVVSSVRSSFKVSNIGPAIGAFDQDRLPGMRGMIGAEARTTPMTIAVRRAGAPETDRRYELELADLPIMRPTLVAVAMLQALEAASRGSGDQSLELRGEVVLEKYGSIPVEQVFEGTGASTGAAIYLLALVGFLEFNSFDDVTVTSIDLELEQWSGQRLQKIRSVVPSAREVRPGDEVELFVELQAHRGERLRRSLSVPIPAGLAPGSYYLFVGDGASVDAARLQIVPEEAQRIEDSLELFGSFHSQRDLMALGVRRGSGLVSDGRALPNLPGSMRSLLRQRSGPAPQRLSLEVVDETVVSLDEPMDGLVRIDLRVVSPRAAEQSRP